MYHQMEAENLHLKKGEKQEEISKKGEKQEEIPKKEKNKNKYQKIKKI